MGRIYPPALAAIEKANASDIETQFLDLHLVISNGFVSSNLKVYDKRNDFDFYKVNFAFIGCGRSLFYLSGSLHFSTYSIC